MDMINQTALPADLYRSVLTEDKLIGMAVCRVTYRIAEGGKVVRDAENPLPVSKGPLDTSYGPFPGDAVFRKEGVDLLAAGFAHAPGGRPVKAMEVTFRVDDFQVKLAVLGDRVWKKGLTGLSIKGPEPFASMPLTWERAYGGEATVQEKALPNPDNPGGLGYVLEKKSADGVKLPNLEDPTSPILSWEDKPRPLCFAPLPVGSYLQSEHAVRHDEETGEPHVLPSFFNCAHPKMRIPELTEGADVELTGMSQNGSLRFSLPLIHLICEVDLEDRNYNVPARADTLCLLPEENRFAITYRAGFTYSFKPEEKRLAHLRFATPDEMEVKQ